MLRISLKLIDRSISQFAKSYHVLYEGSSLMNPTPIRLLATAAAVLTLSSQASAISIGVASVNDATTFSLSGDANSRQGLSSTTVLNAGGSVPDVVSNSVLAAVRYQSIAAADNGNGSNQADQAIVNSNYSATFVVTAAPGVSFNLTIDTRLSGALTIIDDYSLGNGTSGTAAVVSNVSGTLNAIANPSLGLNVIASTTNGTSSTNDVPILATNQLIAGPFVGTGAPVAYTLQFSWSTRATSNATSSSFDNADEAAARFGLTATIGGGGGTFEQNGGIIADDYPGPGNRVQANDGHFLNVTATVTAIPEPGSVVLGGIAGLSLLVMAWRHPRRK